MSAIRSLMFRCMIGSSDSISRTILFLFVSSFTLSTALLAGCGGDAASSFSGSGEFLITAPSGAGAPVEQRMASSPVLRLRQGRRGGTDLELTSNCVLRSHGRSILGTLVCKVDAAGGPYTADFRQGTWSVLSRPVDSGTAGCSRLRHTLSVAATGTLRKGASSTAAVVGTVAFTFTGSQEVESCASTDYAGSDSGSGWGGGGEWGWGWVEEPPNADWDQGDWDDPGSWSGGDDDGWGDDDNDDDDGWGDDGGDDGGDDDGGDDGGGDDGGGDDGGGDDGGDFAPKTRQAKSLTRTVSHP